MRISDFDSIIRSERLMLIDFYATWCGACSAMDQTLDRVALALSDLVTVVRINTSTPSSRELVRRYNIVAVPTLILFSHGDRLWRESGIVSFDRLCSTIRRFRRLTIF